MTKCRLQKLLQLAFFFLFTPGGLSNSNHWVLSLSVCFCQVQKTFFLPIPERKQPVELLSVTVTSLPLALYFCLGYTWLPSLERGKRHSVAKHDRSAIRSNSTETVVGGGSGPEKKNSTRHKTLGIKKRLEFECRPSYKLKITNLYEGPLLSLSLKSLDDFSLWRYFRNISLKGGTESSLFFG